MLRASPLFTIMDAKASSGAGYPRDISLYQVKHLLIATDGGGIAALTVKIQGSEQETVPNFDAAQSVTNQWTYIETNDLDDGDPITGNVGVTFSVADGYVTLEVNSAGLKWINAKITSYTAGALTIKLRCYDNK